MRRLFALLAPLSTISIALSIGGCEQNAAVYRNALTGEPCEPDDSFVPLGDDHPGRGGHNSPTGIPGDNLDDEHSGRVDCLGDGNSGQGDDKKHNCEFPPGCDDTGCCDDDVFPPGDDPDDPGDDPGDDDPGDDDPGDDDPGDDDPGDDPGSDDPGSDDPGDPGSDDPGSSDPSTDDPGSDSPSCDVTCAADSECGDEAACVDGCCTDDVL